MAFSLDPPTRPEDAEAVALIRSDKPHLDKAKVYFYRGRSGERTWQDRTSETHTRSMRQMESAPPRVLSRDNGLPPPVIQPSAFQPYRRGVLRGGGKDPPESKVQFSPQTQTAEFKEDGPSLELRGAESKAGRVDYDSKEPPRRRPRKRKRVEYPPPPRDPDDMSDAELAAFTETLSDAQYEAFMDDYELDSGSDSESEGELDTKHAGPAPLVMELPDGAAGTPLQHLGEDFAQRGPGDSHLRRREQKVLAQALSNVSTPEEARLALQEIKDPERREMLERRVDEAYERVENRTSGREVELNGGDTFEPLLTKTRRCMLIAGPQVRLLCFQSVGQNLPLSASYLSVGRVPRVLSP